MEEGVVSEMYHIVEFAGRRGLKGGVVDKKCFMENKGLFHS